MKKLAVQQFVLIKAPQKLVVQLRPALVCIWKPNAETGRLECFWQSETSVKDEAPPERLLWAA